MADIVAPLNNLKKKVVWEWTEECQVAFELLKRMLQAPPVLAQPQLLLGFQVHCDASDVGLGAVLMQNIEGEEKVIAFDGMFYILLCLKTSCAPLLLRCCSAAQGHPALCEMLNPGADDFVLSREGEEFSWEPSPAYPTPCLICIHPFLW